MKTPWDIYMARPALQFSPGSASISMELVKALLLGSAEIEDHGKSKGPNEGYPTFKVSVKAGKLSWHTFRLSSQANVDTLIDWLVGVPS